MTFPSHPGGGRYQVGNRIRFTGEPRVFHRGQRVIQPGEEGVIVHDFGYDYRYLIRLDRSAGIRAYHASCDCIFDIRPGMVRAEWELVA